MSSLTSVSAKTNSEFSDGGIEVKFDQSDFYGGISSACLSNAEICSHINNEIVNDVQSNRIQFLLEALKTTSCYQNNLGNIAASDEDERPIFSEDEDCGRAHKKQKMSHLLELVRLRSETLNDFPKVFVHCLNTQNVSQLRDYIVNYFEANSHFLLCLSPDSRDSHVRIINSSQFIDIALSFMKLFCSNGDVKLCSIRFFPKETERSVVFKTKIESVIGLQEYFKFAQKKRKVPINSLLDMMDTSKLSPSSIADIKSLETNLMFTEQKLKIKEKCFVKVTINFKKNAIVYYESSRRLVSFTLHYDPEHLEFLDIINKYGIKHMFGLPFRHPSKIL